MNKYRVTALSILLLCLCLEFPCIDTECNIFWKEMPKLYTKVHLNSSKIYGNISLSAQITDGDVLNVSCIGGRVVSGSKILICQNNTWNHDQPKCIVKRHSHKLPWTIIGPSIGAGVILIFAVTTFSVLVIRRRRKKNKDTVPGPNVPFGNTELSAEYFQRGKDSDRYADVYYSQVDKGHKLKDTQSHDDSRRVSAGNMDIHRHSDGISLVGSSASVLGISNIPIYKVWTCRRTRRKFIRAENIEHLKRKAAAIYQYDNPVRLALEEDGTEVDGDDVLTSYSNQTLVVLSGNERWVDPSGKTDQGHIQKYTFDVCSQDRDIRKLILAENMKDLIRQAKPCVGYSIESVCLEEDGTCIEDDDTLLLMSGKTLMMLGKDHTWAPKQHEIPTIEYPDKQRYSNDTKQSTFKVWSADYAKKKIVKADNCIELHLKAAKMLEQVMPIQIRVKDENTIISSDKVLDKNKDNVLIASQTNPPRWIGSDGDVLQTATENESGNQPFGNHTNEIGQKRTSYLDQNRYENGQRYRLPNQINDSSVKHYNPPDVVILSEPSFDTMPPRYEPSSQLRHNFSNSTNDDEPVRFKKIDIHENEAHSKSFPSQHNEVFTSKENYFNNKNISQQHINGSQENHNSFLNSHHNIEREQYLNDRDVPVFSKMNFQKFPKQNQSQPSGNFGKPSAIKSDLTGKSASSLPYSNLEPLHRTKQIGEMYSTGLESNRSDATNDHGLPYSDLEPTHRKGRMKNNFEIMRQQQKQDTRSVPMENVVFQRDGPSLFRQPSFLVTGGAKQSSQSDVLF